jgi:hypothetical protein
MMLLQVVLILCTAGLVSPAHGQESSATGEAPADEAVLVGAGDIAKCDMIGGAAAEDFAKCYEPTWGRHKARTRPAPGNHDYNSDKGRHYYEYYGENAGPAGQGYYSYDLGSWHVISLNSVIDIGPLSPQVRWLKEDLAAHPVDCIAAYWHGPLFSSGPHSTDKKLEAFWRVLYDAGADIVMNGHDHLYERFAPQDPYGKADPERGIRQFIVGTGGGGVYKFKRPLPNSEVRDNSTYGVLKLTLGPGRYAWEFVPIAGQTFTDSGTGTCSPHP